jgi:polyphosphate:AMP phosphotransferase
MFESAELGHTIGKTAYKRALPRLRESLLDTQYEILRKQQFQVVVIVAGFDLTGRGATVNRLLEWVDPRHVEVHAFRPPSVEELARPPMWRFWRTLPPKGKMAVYFAGWYGQPMLEHADGSIGRKALQHRLEEIKQLELLLVNEGALVLKFWLHLSKKAQRQRLEKLLSDRDSRWHVSEEARQAHRQYNSLRSTADLVLRETSTSAAPWLVIDASDERFRHLSVGRLLRDAMQKRLRQQPRAGGVSLPLSASPRSVRSVLGDLDLGLGLGPDKYEKELERWQGRLNLLSRRKRFREHGLIGVFEGPDASGKGGAIRRIVQALDARQLRVVPIAAPTDEERAHPYLWRFWRRFPALGEIVLFDRSWYGRVLVERVENLCTEPDWRRAYAEICEFETELARHGILLMKFYLHISPQEQLQRLRERRQTPYKRFKITRDDWRNHRLRRQYDQAACDMIEHTSTEIAPWTLVEAEDKRYARVRILRALCQRIEEATE